MSDPSSSTTENEPITREQLSKEVNRFKDQAGKESSSLEETELKLIRQFGTIKTHIEHTQEAHLELIEGIKTELTNWRASAAKHVDNQTIVGYLAESGKMLEELK